MRCSTRYLLALLLTVPGFSVSFSARAQTKYTGQPARGSISGRVTIKEKGVSGVPVGLRKNDNSNPFEPFQKATTDQDGNYRFNNISAGGYQVVPSVPAFVLTDPKGGKTKQVVVGEDENVEGVDFAMVRGGVITGRVTDADGRPVLLQQVTVFLVTNPEQSAQQPVQAVSSGQTDDRGIYRIYGLMPGLYKVASGRSEDPTSFVFSRYIYNQVFHPNVPDIAKAAVIEVSESSEATNVDIVLGRALQTFSVAGRTVDSEKNLPVPNLRFGFMRTVGSRVEYVGSFATSNAKGEFVVEGLTPGKYGAYLFPNPANEMRAESSSFEVVDQDLSGVVIKLSRGASLSGVVVFETEDKAVLSKLSELQLRAFVSPPPGTTSSGSSIAMIAPDGSFRLSGLSAGTVNIRLSAVNTPFPPKGISLVRIERDGVPSPRLEIKDGEQLTGIRIVLSYGSASLRGVIELENGTLPEGARFFVRLGRPGETSPMQRPPQVDARGHFLIEDIAPGTYEVTVSLVNSTPATQPARSVKRVVVVQDGVANDVTIKFDLGAKP